MPGIEPIELEGLRQLRMVPQRAFELAHKPLTGNR